MRNSIGDILTLAAATILGLALAGCARSPVETDRSVYAQGTVADAPTKTASAATKSRNAANSPVAQPDSDRLPDRSVRSGSMPFDVRYGPSEGDIESMRRANALSEAIGEVSRPGTRAYHRGDYEAAEVHLRSAIEKARRLTGSVDGPLSATVRTVLGMALVELGRYEEGIEYLEAARKNTSMDGMIENLVIAYVRTGRIEEARPYAEKWGTQMVELVGLPLSALPDLRTPAGIEAVALLKRGGERSSMSPHAYHKDTMEAERIAPDSDLVRHWAAAVCWATKDYRGSEERWAALLGKGNEKHQKEAEGNHRRAGIARRIVEKRAQASGG